MKTTGEISDELLKEARKVAAREGTTVRAMVEQGLRQVLEQRKAAKAFRLRKASFKGNGSSPRFRVPPGRKSGRWRTRAEAGDGPGAQLARMRPSGKLPTA